MSEQNDLPVAVIGAGPVGLAATVHLQEQGVPVKLYEAGDEAGSNLRDWGHVRVFTPWRYCVDQAARKLLEATAWDMPDPEAFPTANELVDLYLEPLTKLPQLSSVIETGARVTGISRWGADKVRGKEREARPFMLVVETTGGIRRDSARAVIDASGTWRTPNPLGAGGIAAEGEAKFADSIAYGIPDILGRERTLYAGRTTLVAGSGHSAANALLDLARLADDEPGTAFIWTTRGTDLVRIYGGGDLDALPARGELGSDVRDLAESGRVRLVTGFATKFAGRAAACLSRARRRTVCSASALSTASSPRPASGPISAWPGSCGSTSIHGWKASRHWGR